MHCQHFRKKSVFNGKNAIHLSRKKLFSLCKDCLKNCGTQLQSCNSKGTYGDRDPEQISNFTSLSIQMILCHIYKKIDILEYSIKNSKNKYNENV